MDAESYQRLKEAEKEHLRALRRLKEAVRLLKRRSALDQALERLTTQTQAALEAHAEALERLKLETAYQEARLELALEHRTPSPTVLSDTAQPPLRVQDVREPRPCDPETETAAQAPVPEKTLGRFRPAGA